MFFADSPRLCDCKKTEIFNDDCPPFVSMSAKSGFINDCKRISHYILSLQKLVLQVYVMQDFKLLFASKNIEIHVFYIYADFM